MSNYILINAKGERATIGEERLERFVLEINGGGYTVQQTASAMVDGNKVRDGFTVTRNGWTIRRCTAQDVLDCVREAKDSSRAAVHFKRLGKPELARQQIRSAGCTWLAPAKRAAPEDPAMPMPELKQLNCRYGAPMGRRSITEIDPEHSGKVFLRHVPFVDGCYDRGGAYWGAPANLYRAYCEVDNGRELEVLDYFLRANSRDQAKAILREEYPNLRFYR